MLSVEEIVGKVNQRIIEIQSRIGVITGTRNGTEGRDRLFGSDGDDRIFGLGGNDTTIGNFGDDLVDGGAGDDLVTGGFGNDVVVGGDGRDRVFGDIGDDLVFGGNGNDLLDGSVGSDILFGGAGNDNITGGTNGDINAEEDFFRDFLVGGAGSDTLNGFGGGVGNVERDILIGGGEVDDNGISTVTSDGVQDTFVLGNANGLFYAAAGDNDFAEILGFEVGIDRIDFGTTTPNISFGLDATGTSTVIFANNNGNLDAIATIVGVI